MIYLDNAATSFPKPKSVIQKALECQKKYCGNPGRSSHRLAVKAAEEIFCVRERIAALLSYEKPENVVFTQNATYALNLAIKTTITEKCHVIISDLEHNSVIRPIAKLGRTLGVEYSVFDTDKDIKEAIEELIRPDTRAIICTLTSNVTGKEIPLYLLSQIREKYGIKLIIDASQAIGHTPINLTSTPCDVLCAPGHKALFGLQGCGFAVFCDKQSRDSYIEGGSGSGTLNPLMPELLPEHFEAGTLPTPSIVSLGAGIDYINRIGMVNIENKLKALTDAFSYVVKLLPNSKIYGCGGGIISFSLEGIPSSIVSSDLDCQGICTRSGLHCAPLIHEKLKTTKFGLVRISLSILNQEYQAEKLLKALRNTSAKYR